MVLWAILVGPHQPEDGENSHSYLPVLTRPLSKPPLYDDVMQLGQRL